MMNGMASSSSGGSSSSSLTKTATAGSYSRGGTVTLWPNPVPLECGIIRTLDKDKPSSSSAVKHGGQRFPTGQLKKLLLYARGKGKGCYPNIRFSNWLNIATNKLNMTPELAWLYFETFDVVSEIHSRDRLELLQLTSQCSTREELDELRKKLSVNTVQFILFLYIQNIPRYSLKAPMVTGEEWPSSESDLRQKSSEDYHLMFLKANLQMILELLQYPEQVLPEDSVTALGFILSSARDLKECPLLELAVSAGSHSGYSKAAKTFSVHQFDFWVRSLLTINPFGPHSLLSRRKELKPPTCFHSDRNGKILNNIAAPLKHRCTLLYKVSKQTVALSDVHLHHGDVYIRNCQRANIYLLAPVRSVHVVKCSRCVLILGAVASAVVVNNSDYLNVSTACRRLHVSSSSTCVFHLLTMTRPLLLSASLHITLAPYNTHYPSLDQHLSSTGLSTSHNCWDSPIDFTGEPTVTWGLMPPEVFRPTEVPFDLPGKTEEILCPLPESYLKALAAKKRRLVQWYAAVEKAHLTKEQSKQLWSVVREHFDEWLVTEGHKKELLDLGLKSAPLPANLDTQQASSRSSGSLGRPAFQISPQGQAHPIEIL